MSAVTGLASRHTLEDEILQGTHASAELRAALHELLARFADTRGTPSLESLATQLAEFTPTLPVERAEEWQARAQQRWLEITKPDLIERLADHFIR